jgi:hypothetical protein
MLTKEKLAETFEGLARIFPGIPSYQQREGLRTQDKVIRTELARRIHEQIGRIDHLKAQLTDRAVLAPLADLDRLCRRLQRSADSIRFASYGYAGLFSRAPVDEAKLAELYDYDLTLGKNVEELAGAVDALQQRQEHSWQKGSFQDIGAVVERLEERIAGRESLFTSQ